VRRLLCLALPALFLCSTVVLLALPPQVPQTAPPTPPRPTDPQFGRHRNHDETLDAIEKQQQAAHSKERYEQLKHDADRLLQLATELKLSVDKSGQNVLALDAVRKADEIEKLARSVRTRMKGQP
jgi:hypothetical protein